MSAEARHQRARPRAGPRAMQACQSCAASKTKCDNDRHCRRCRKKNVPCIRQLASERLTNPARDVILPEEMPQQTQTRSDNMRAGTPSISVMATEARKKLFRCLEQS